MPYQIAWEGQSTANVTYSGMTDSKEVLDVVKILNGDWRFDMLKRVLHDFTGIDGYTDHDQSALEDVSALNNGAALYHPNVKIAIVTERIDVIDVVNTYEEMSGSPYPLQIFATRAAALTWLGQ